LVNLFFKLYQLSLRIFFRQEPITPRPGIVKPKRANNIRFIKSYDQRVAEKRQRQSISSQGAALVDTSFLVQRTVSVSTKDDMPLSVNLLPPRNNFFPKTKLDKCWLS
jgi:hypothetical protein